MLINRTNDSDTNISLTVTELSVNLILGVVGSTTFIINSIVVVGFIKDKRVREAPGNIFIKNLAISDALNGVFVCYVAILNLCKYENDQEYLFRMGFILGFLIASTSFLNFLTVDRYLKVAMHMRYMTLVTARKQKFVCLFTWFACVVFALLPTLGWHNPDVRSLRFFETFPKTYIVFVFCIGVAPVFCMIFAYTKLFFIANYQRKRIASLGQIREGAQEMRKTVEIVRSIFLLIGAFLICWLPVGLYCLVGAAKGRDPNKSSIPVFTLLVTMGFVNSLLNPLIYATKVTEIREFFKQVLCRCCRTIR